MGPLLFDLVEGEIGLDDLRRGLFHPSAGGFATFEGWVRDHHDGRGVHHLEYQAYPALCRKEGERILGEAMERFGLRGATAVHRTGPVPIGGVAVWVGTCADHRREALDACSWIIDAIKDTLPVWKKEYFADGTAEWVRCDRCAKDHVHAHRDGHGHPHGAPRNP